MRIGIIGYGNRMDFMYGQILEICPEIELMAIYDTNPELVRTRLKDRKHDLKNTTFCISEDDLFEKHDIDGVMIGTRCSQHARLAIKALELGVPVFLEKPVATNMNELVRLKEVYACTKTPVVVSFPLRASQLVRYVKEVLDSGKIGTVEHVQAVNNVPYGAVYYQCWYRDESETQGLFLQKATHDFDYLNYLLGSHPSSICAMTSKQVYKGVKPANLFCKNCCEFETCTESPFYKKHFSYETVFGDEMCCFAVDTGNEDTGDVLIKYDSGAHVNYSQNFFARKGAAMRGARLIGYKGTLEFDFYKEEIRIFMHHRPVAETCKFEFKGSSHFGGDITLSQNFIKVMRKEQDPVSPLNAGLLSALMCLKAKKSSETGRFEEIDWT